MPKGYVIFTEDIHDAAPSVPAHAGLRASTIPAGAGP